LDLLQLPYLNLMAIAAQGCATLVPVIPQKLGDIKGRVIRAAVTQKIIFRLGHGAGPNTTICAPPLEPYTFDGACAGWKSSGMHSVAVHDLIIPYPR